MRFMFPEPGLLRVLNLTVSEQGTYTCRAKVQDGEDLSGSIQLTVIGKRTFYGIEQKVTEPCGQVEKEMRRGLGLEVIELEDLGIRKRRGEGGGELK